MSSTLHPRITCGSVDEEHAFEYRSTSIFEVMKRSEAAREDLRPDLQPLYSSVYRKYK